jgi:hypothetical protein
VRLTYVRLQISRTNSCQTREGAHPSDTREAKVPRSCLRRVDFVPDDELNGLDVFDSRLPCVNHKNWSHVIHKNGRHEIQRRVATDSVGPRVARFAAGRGQCKGHVRIPREMNIETPRFEAEDPDYLTWAFEQTAVRRIQPIRTPLTRASDAPHYASPDVHREWSRRRLWARWCARRPCVAATAQDTHQADDRQTQQESRHVDLWSDPEGTVWTSSTPNGEETTAISIATCENERAMSLRHTLPSVEDRETCALGRESQNAEQNRGFLRRGH